jgi:nicotinate-nucleotide adenylyltransferase
MRIGVYGGSFNPPHTGHALAAAELIRKLSLDKLLIVPAADPPHKTLAAGSPGALDRLALCQAAFDAIPGAEVCDLELHREGKSYTVDTLAELTAVHPEDDFVLIMGTDMFLSFTTWREPERIASLATLAVMHRDDRADTWSKVRLEAQRLQETMNARVETVENECVEISSTTVRRLLAFGAPDCLAPAVLKLILENGWYLSGNQLKGLSFDALRDVALPLHDEKRRAHVLGTAETALALAERWGADTEAARRAGILHDITKALSKKEQLHICEKYAMMPTSFQIDNPKLLHAVTGAVVAQEAFGESDPVVSAIRWHTTGRLDMSLLEKILYIADYIEPTRDFSGVEILRDLAWNDLDAAILCGLERSVEYVRSKGNIVDPDSLEAWSYYRKITERSKLP